MTSIPISIPGVGNFNLNSGTPIPTVGVGTGLSFIEGAPTLSGAIQLPAAAPRLPNYRPASETRVADAVTINSVSLSIEQQRQTQAASNRKFGVVYGSTSLAARLDVLQKSGSYYYFRAIVCIGEIEAIDSVTLAGKTYTSGDATADPDYVGDWSSITPTVTINAGEIYAYNSKFWECTESFSATSKTAPYNPEGEYSSYFTQLLDNVTTYSYTGTTSQGVDPLMSELFGGGYTETLTGSFSGTSYGLAYVTGKIEALQLEGSGFPSVIVSIRGKKVYDPETATTVYSANGALCLADFISNAVYGMGLTVDYDSVTAAKTRAYNCNMGFTIDPVSTASVMETLTAYASVFLRYENGEYVFVVDGPTSSSGSIKWTGGDVNLAEIPELVLANWAQRPNVVRVYYTDGTKEKSYEIESARVTANTDDPRVQEYRMPGFTTLAQATRFATERLNELENEKLTASVTVFHEGLLVRVGQVWTLTLNYPEQTPVNAQAVRVVSRRHVAVGLWQIQLREYSADNYEAV